MRSRLMLTLGILLVLASVAGAAPPQMSPTGSDDGLLSTPPVIATPPSGSRDAVITNLNTTETFASIQEAIDDLETLDGHTLKFTATTHAEGGAPQIIVDKAVTIEGASGGTTITPVGNTGTSGDGRAWILITASGVTLSDLILDGTGYAIEFGMLANDTADNTTVDDCIVQHLHSSSIYRGRGIVVYGGSAQVTDCTLSDIGRIGVYAYGSAVVTTVDNLHYTGKGDGDWLDYGVEAEGGATINIIDSYITDCTGVALSDGSGSAGVLGTTYFAAGTTITLDGCTVTGNSMGVAVGFSSTHEDQTSATIHGCDLSGNIDGGVSYGVVSYWAGNTVDAEGNWWGDTDPSNDVDGDVDYSPAWGDNYVGDPHTSPWVWYTDDSIKAAIAAAESGDEIHVAPGTYVEAGQIAVDKDLSILGDPDDMPVVMTDRDTGTSGDPRGWWLVPADITVTLQNLILDGTGYKIWQGIRAWGAGTLADCVLRNITYDPSTSYMGVGFVCMGDGNWTVTGNTFENMGRIGMMAFGTGVTGAVFSGNTYTGKGSGNWLDYGIELGGGAVATITSNVITGCEGVASSDGSTSAGILITTYFGAGTTGTIISNDLSGNTTGIAVGYDGADASTVVAHYNNLSDNDYGIESTAAAVDGEMNWWGDNSGPGGAGGGTGVPVSLHVDYDPWIGQSGTGNVVYNPDPLEISSADAVGGGVYRDATYVRYLGGGSAALYGYSIDVTFTESAVTFFSATRPETGPFATAQLFQVVNLGAGRRRIDCAIGGANPGTYGPADLCKVTFQAAGCAVTPPATLGLTVISARDSDNNPISGVMAVGGSVAVDVTDPTVSAVSIVRTNLPETGYVKDGDDLEIAVTVTDACGDVAGFLATADLSELLEGGDAATPPTTYLPDGLGGYVATWVLLGMDLTAPDGAKTIDVTVEDPLGSTTTVSGTTIVDNTAPPNAVTAMNAAPGHNKCVLTWTNPAIGDPNTDNYGIMIRRTLWGSYPLYPGSGPAYPSAATGAEVYNAAGMVETYPDNFAADGSARDICYYRVFVFDKAYNFTAGADYDHDRATNYWLGDVSAELPPPPPPYDGRVTTIDISALGSTYYAVPPSNYHCDVGPTDDHSRIGIPTTDGLVDFEDLMIFAMNYGVVTPLMVPPFTVPDGPRDGEVAFSIELPEAMSPGSEFEARVMLSDADGVVQGARFVVTYDANVVEYLGSRPGSLVQGIQSSFFMPVLVEGLPDVSAAALGEGVTFGHSGELAKVRFRVVGEGTISLGLRDIQARNVLNEDLLAGSSDVVEGPGEVKLPTEVFLHSAQPNPFGGATTLSYGLPEAAPVKLAVYDVSGRLVRVLAEGQQSAGEHPVLWDGRDEAGSRVATGLYLYRLETKVKTITKKLIVTE